MCYCYRSNIIVHVAATCSQSVICASFFHDKICAKFGVIVCRYSFVNDDVILLLVIVEVVVCSGVYPPPYLESKSGSSFPHPPLSLSFLPSDPGRAWLPNGLWCILSWNSAASDSNFAYIVNKKTVPAQTPPNFSVCKLCPSGVGIEASGCFFCTLDVVDNWVCFYDNFNWGWVAHITFIMLQSCTYYVLVLPVSNTMSAVV